MDGWDSGNDPAGLCKLFILSLEGDVSLGVGEPVGAGDASRSVGLLPFRLSGPKQSLTNTEHHSHCRRLAHQDSACSVAFENTLGNAPYFVEVEQLERLLMQVDQEDHFDRG